VLKNGSLAYYENQADLVPKGEMALYGAAVIFVGPPKVTRNYCIEISSPTRTLYVAAEDQNEAKDWAIAIQRAAIASTGGGGLPALPAPSQKQIDIKKLIDPALPSKQDTTSSKTEGQTSVGSPSASAAPSSSTISNPTSPNISSTISGPTKTST